MATPSNDGAALRDESPSLGLALLLPALAGGMGWGIRGQYGHETGAMIAGVLVGFSLVLLYLRRAPSLLAARVVALLAVGVSFGGSETYGQTVGLTHDKELVGHQSALLWGLLGLFIKGGLWIGFAGALLGMGLGGKRYRPREMALLTLGMTALLLLGMTLLNRPFDPAHKQLPAIYFSDDWRWEPGAALKPREERWGGLLFALAGLLGYTGFVRKDRLARNLGLIGILAGGLGFSLGQCVQAYHAWHPEQYKTGLLGWLEPNMNWWNMMEISFGTIMGFGLGLGVYLHRGRIVLEETPEEAMPAAAEWLLLAAHAAILTLWSFYSFDAFDQVADIAFPVALIPLVGIAGGRLWPYWTALPVVALPICGKTLREMSYEHADLSRPVGWLVFVIVPLLATFLVAQTLARGGRQENAEKLGRWGLLWCVWLYFGLNWGFFRFPWVWAPWTGRTPSGIIYTVCALVLTAAALRYRKDQRSSAATAGSSATA